MPEGGREGGRKGGKVSDCKCHTIGVIEIGREGGREGGRGGLPCWIHQVAYVPNLKPRVGSYFWTARSRPRVPSCEGGRKGGREGGKSG